MSGDVLVFVSVWLAFVLWAAGEVTLTYPEGWRRRLGRIEWTLGVAAMAGHLAAAFQFRHHWSHTAAVVETARQTGMLFGVNWGGGVWFNYALWLWWSISATHSWMALAGWERPGRFRWLRRGFFWFMWFNAAFVFIHGPARWLGLVVCLVVLTAWIGEFRRARLARAPRPVTLGRS